MPAVAVFWHTSTKDKSKRYTLSWVGDCPLEATLNEILATVMEQTGKSLKLPQALVTEVQTEKGVYLPREGLEYLRSSAVFKTWEEMEVAWARESCQAAAN